VRRGRQTQNQQFCSRIAEAHAAYQDSLVLWKNADPNIAILIAAKAECAKLK